MSDAHAPPRDKDKWDKASITGQVLVPVMLAALTTVYSCQETAQKHAEARESAALQKANTTAAQANAVAAFLPYVRGNADSTQIKIVSAALANLGYEEFAVKLAALGHNASSVQVLETLATTADSAATRDSAVSALARISSAAVSAVDTGRTRLASLADSALVRVQANDSASPGDETAIVTGGYGNVQQAVANANSTREGGYSAAAYLRNGVPRTAIRFGTRQEARRALPEIRTNVRRSAYIVDWNRWCPGAREKDGYIECLPSQPEERVN